MTAAPGNSSDALRSNTDFSKVQRSNSLIPTHGNKRRERLGAGTSPAARLASQYHRLGGEHSYTSLKAATES